ncbi:MAG TPA: AAA family ATPase [Thermoflexus sp.]|nr:AAA family ATPase [Thermoflexus sp.]
MGIEHLEIRNFKSIKALRIPCRRVNLFIGPPNTGKSNLLEALGLFSVPYTKGDLKNVVRCEKSPDLFYDHDLENAIEIVAGDYKGILRFEKEEPIPFHLTIRGPKGMLSYDYRYEFNVGSYSGGGAGSPSPFRLYRFRPLNDFPMREPEFLRPVAGDNLLYVLLTHKRLHRQVASLADLQKYGMRLVLKPHESKIEVQKESDGIAIAYPYITLSDTLQRMIFYLVAIESNENAVLIFEEPEVHAFPPYITYLAERIAKDLSNQYFISTHHPDFLLSVVEKAPREDVAVFLTNWKDGQTQVRMLEETEIPELLDLGSSVFFNLDQFFDPAGEE